MFHVVTGGSGSGKSAYAEEQICMLKKRQIPVICIILQPWSYGKETEQKILRHRQMRNGKGLRRWNVLQILRKLVQTEPGFRADATEEGICVLLECMSNLTANELYLDTGAKERTREAVLEGIRELEKRCRGLVAVTNEVFCDLLRLTKKCRNT